MIEEQILQKFPRRCPYCERVLEKEPESKGGKRGETCPYCGKVFIRLSWEEAVQLGGRGPSR